MRQFEISVTSKALSDVDKLRFAIVFKYRAPLTAKRYLKGLNDTIQSLKSEQTPFKLTQIYLRYTDLIFGESTTKR